MTDVKHRASFHFLSFFGFFFFESSFFFFFFISQGLVKNDSDTLAQVGIVQGSKVMLIGSTLNDVVKINVESDQVAAALATGILVIRARICTTSKKMLGI